MTPGTPPVFRFAPSPNGALHLGHAYSALLNFDLARGAGGRFLLRIEDIDITRCRPELEAAMLGDLEWLGIEWEEPPRRQSDHFDFYAQGLARLKDAGLVYPSFMSRKDIRLAAEEKGEDWPHDPDGVPHYPGDERDWNEERIRKAEAQRRSQTGRLDMGKALRHRPSRLVWQEKGEGPDGGSGEVVAAPEDWGDVAIARLGTPTSYHLAVVCDDALQGITHVVRGQDMFHATSVHRLLQHLLDLPAPVYHHHGLIKDGEGQKLSKRIASKSLKALRENGHTPADIRRMVGLSDDQ